MKQSLSQLVNVILERLAKQPGASSESGIRTWLLRQGYAQRDIDAAMKMVGRRPGSGMPGLARPARLRHLSEYESLRLSPEAQAALVRLEMYELIEPGEREALLERLDQIEGPVGLADLEYLLSWIVCPTRDVETQQTIYAVLDDKSGHAH
jgi:uncharacterized protein Smg (DUF494 family)